METATAEVPVEVKKALPAQTTLPDVWQSFRAEMDRLFDRFGSGFGFPSQRRMFDIRTGVAQFVQLFDAGDRHA